MLTLIVNGEVYSPALRGEIDVLIVGEKIAKLGQVNRAAVEAIGVEVEIVDASGRIVTPGFIDPHEHLHGGSGEQGCEPPPCYSVSTRDFNLSHGSVMTFVMLKHTAKPKSLNEIVINFLRG